MLTPYHTTDSRAGFQTRNARHDGKLHDKTARRRRPPDKARRNRPASADFSLRRKGRHRRMTHLIIRWALPIIGGGVALELIFWLYQDLDFGRFVTGLRHASPAWVVVLGLAILLE